MWINGKWVAPGFYFAPEKGGGGGTSPADPPPGDDDPPATPPPDDTPGADPPKSGKVEFSTEQQEAIDSLIGERLKRAKTKWDKALEQETEKAEREAKETHLKEQEEWQKLAEQHQVKVDELEPQVETLTERVEAYEQVITEMLTAQIKSLGDEAKKAVENLPGEPDALAKLQGLTANEGLFSSDGTPPGTPPPGRKRKKEPAETEPVRVRI